MDFQKLLLGVGRALCKEEVKALAFLCADLLGQNPTSVESTNDLFSRLADQDHLSPEQPWLLIELLQTIQRTRLVRELNLDLSPNTTRNLISPFRKLLYCLSEEITGDDLKQVKFLLNKTLPRRKLEENVTTLEVFLEMEHMDLLSDTNLEELEKIIRTVCPVLQERINQFKARMTLQLQLQNEFSINSSNTSMDFPVGLHGGNDGTLNETHSLSSFKDHLRNNDTTFLLPEEQKTSEKQMVETTYTNNEHLGTYPMGAAKRGICLIVNNHKFQNCHLSNREGTVIDERCLQVVFKWLGFEVEIKRDCTSEEMRSVLRELGRRDHTQMDCVVCCVLSHGLEGRVYGVNGQTIELKDLMNYLNGSQCPSLAGKPKLLFIQACQGNKEQKAIRIKADSPDLVCSDAIEAIDSIPSDADFLQAMATVPSFVSFREKTRGTWFIQSLCQNLIELVPRKHDLVSILTKVNADVSQRTDRTGEKKQMPQPAFSLRKKVIFPVPKAPPPSLPSV